MWFSKVNRGSNYSNALKKTRNIIPHCGLTSLTHRIYGGNQTQLDDYPWMALLEYQKRKYIHFFIKKYLTTLISSDDVI